MARQTIDFNKIGHGLGSKPDNFKPVHKRRLRVDFKCDQHGLQFRFSQNVKDDYKASRTLSSTSPSLLQTFVRLFRKRYKSTLDFFIWAPCEVEISLEKNLRFPAGYHALRTVEDCTKLYRDLRHVDPKDPKNLTEFALEGCRKIIFSAVDPRKSEEDPDKDNDAFNLFVEVLNPWDHRLVLIIDPDIKNDGGKSK